jgi:hypothetical protein
VEKSFYINNFIASTLQQVFSLLILRQLALLPPSLDIYKIEASLENGLKIKISEFRKKNKLSSTNFDPIINSILTTALTNYEW